MPERFRVLYIDDSITQLAAVRLRLQGAGIEVATASTLANATLELHSCDLVIIDFHMPEWNGAEALARLKTRLQETPHPLFYLYTADHAVAAEFHHYGFDGAFTRKGSLDELLRQVQNLMKVVRMRRAIADSRSGR
jgi:two-component system, sensor histidine kinase and response regulator